jgi:hypothetical protein
MTPQEIERTEPTWTVQMVIDQLQLINDKSMPFAIHSSEYGDEPYYGVLALGGGFISITSEWSSEMSQKYAEYRKAEEAKRRQEHWNRPEVREAQERGLLP